MESFLPLNIIEFICDNFKWLYYTSDITNSMQYLYSLNLNIHSLVCTQTSVFFHSWKRMPSYILSYRCQKHPGLMLYMEHMIKNNIQWITIGRKVDVYVECKYPSVIHICWAFNYYSVLLANLLFACSYLPFRCLLRNMVDISTGIC